MSKKAYITMLATLLMIAAPLIACSSNEPITEMQTIATVKRGDLEVNVKTNGYIEMPAAVNLYFDSTMFTPPYSARIEKVYVKKGDLVNAGALLAKLDDTTQKMAVESAQYSLELAINNVVQTVCCGCTRVPSFYSDAVALYRFEFAINEIQKAHSLLADSEFEPAASQIAMAKSDIDAAKNVYTNPEYRNLRSELSEYTEEMISSYAVDTAIIKLTDEFNNISAIQAQIAGGNYSQASKMLESLLRNMTETHSVIKTITHAPGAYTCTDTCTGFTIINEALTKLEEAKQLASSEDVDTLELNETLQIVIHDLELGDKVLQDNVSTYRQGLNLKAERDYSVNIQTALINLDRTKQVLLKTELLAPFDGEIVDVNLHEGDMITQRYSATGLPIDVYVLKLADTGAVTMTGIVDEIDVGKVSKGLQATVLIDAFPGKTFAGQVQFISPYGTLQTGTGTYKIEIALDPEAAPYLTGGLTATAEIQVDEHKDVLLIPNGALHVQGTETWVNVTKEDKTGQVEQRQVQVGLQSQTQTEILSGLSEGEKVLLETDNAPTGSLNSAN
ncbi:MAG: efflux RND transporter periplasmic adaptor subunit [Dehalococcoidia bacterium]|nr:efflux RND transporter periplasmic adaptor subunit [Dehalococcoidia bacterium]